MALTASLIAMDERLKKVIEHAAAMARGFTGKNFDLSGDHVTTYTRPGIDFPRGGGDNPSIETNLDPTGQHKSGLPDKPGGLPSDGTGSGPLPNDGLPNDGTAPGDPGTNPLGFGGGEGA